MCSLFSKDPSFNFYLLLLQLVLCRVAALKVSPYIIHSAGYIFFFGALRSARIFREIRNLLFEIKDLLSVKIHFLTNV